MRKFTRYEPPTVIDLESLALAGSIGRGELDVSTQPIDGTDPGTGTEPAGCQQNCSFGSGGPCQQSCSFGS